MLESGIILLSLYLSLNFGIHVNICIHFWHADGNWIRPFHRVSLELADVWHRCISFVGWAQDRRVPFVIRRAVVVLSIKSSTAFQVANVGLKVVLVVEIPVSRSIFIIKLQPWLVIFEVDGDIRSIGHFWRAFIVHVLTLGILLWFGPHIKLFAGYLRPSSVYLGVAILRRETTSVLFRWYPRHLVGKLGAVRVPLWSSIWNHRRLSARKPRLIHIEIDGFLGRPLVRFEITIILCLWLLSEATWIRYHLNKWIFLRNKLFLKSIYFIINLKWTNRFRLYHILTKIELTQIFRY